MFRSILLSGLICVVLGCQLYSLPETGPKRSQVVDAARTVIEQRYPLSAASQKGDLLLALTPVEVEGLYKTRKQISVSIRRNYTGAWDLMVRVVKHVEVSEPVAFGVDPESENLSLAKPVGTQRWQPLQNLPVEEAALKDEILDKLKA
jgi:hypothetical protein